jgi:hypothetical protein
MSLKTYLFKYVVEGVGVVEGVFVKDECKVSCRGKGKGKGENKGAD